MPLQASAWTDPTKFALWFRGTADGRLEVNAFDCREGGNYDVTMDSASGERFNLIGTHLSLKPAQRIVMSRQWTTNEAMKNPVQVTVNLEATPNGCLLTLLHERFDSAPVRDGQCDRLDAMPREPGRVLPPTLNRQKTRCGQWWARWGSNPRPSGYEPHALTTELQAQSGQGYQTRRTHPIGSPPGGTLLPTGHRCPQ